MHSNSRGRTVELTFDPEYHQELEEAATRVFKRERSSARLQDSDGMVQTSPASKRNRRSYGRKKQSKSQLKILPLSSPSSEEDSVMKTPGRDAAECLFDDVVHSTPVYSSGVPVGAELHVSQEQTEAIGGDGSLRKKLFSSDRKRSVPDSGYLSDQTEGSLISKRRVEPQPEEVESNSPLAAAILVSDGSSDGAEPREVEEGPIGEVEEAELKPKSDPMSGILAVFDTFRTQLQQHMTSCWQNTEAEVVQSLNQCQQHLTALLTAVHQQRMAMLQRFESSVTDHLNQLQARSTCLNAVNTQILSFFQAEMQRLDSFCEENLQRLNSLQSEGAGTERASSQ
ncbi:synaptonemal complex protein 2-like isoform X2 [Antennarius striatus]